MKCILLIISAFFLFSCEGVIEGNGVIISSNKKKPIDSVLVYWTAFGEKSYTDSAGNFEVERFVGYLGDWPKLEVILYKKGYLTKYVNLSEDYDYRPKNVVLEMNPTNKSPRNIEKGEYENYLGYFNFSMLVFSILTLIVICCVKLQYKWMWILSSIFINLFIKHNCYSGEIKVDVFTFFLPLQVISFRNDIAWYIYFIPITAVVFWIYYFITKTAIIKKN